MDQATQKTFRRKFMLVGGVALACYLMSMAFPETLWSVHSIALLPGAWKYGLLGVVALLFSLPFWKIAPSNHWSETTNSSTRKRSVLIGLSALVAVLYYNFPLPVACYGDSLFIKEAVNITIKEWDARLLSEFLDLNLLDTKIGLKTYYRINNFFTWLSGLNGTEVARYINAFVGGVFVLLWSTFCNLHLKQRGWKMLWIGVGLTAPITTVFMGHFETYAFSYTAAMLWLSVLGIYFKTSQRRWLVLLPFVGFIALQTHITYWLLLPSLGFTVLWHYRRSKLVQRLKQIDQKLAQRIPFFSGGVSWSSFTFYVLVPMFVLGAIAYFFIFSNHDGPRQFSMDEFEDTLFLPLYTNEAPPYDRYNLFGVSHLSDYFNVLLMYAGAILVLLLPPLTFLRKKINWNEPLLLLVGGTTVIYFVLFFFFNPLLGLPVDWDLFATPGIFLLAFLVLLYRQLEVQIKLQQIAGPVVALSLLGGCFLVVNATPSLLSKHLLVAGQHNYKTYWIGTSTLMVRGLELIGDAERESEVRQQLLAKLEPCAVLQNDKEYAQLLLDEGRYHFQHTKQFEQALAYFEKANQYGPRLSKNIYYLVLTHFELQQYQEAFYFADLLAKSKYQPYKRTLKIAIHTALAAQEYQNAANYAVTYLKRWPDDSVIQTVEERLRTGDQIASIIELFGK